MKLIGIDYSCRICFGRVSVFLSSNWPTLLGKWLRFNNYVNSCDSSAHNFLGNQNFSRLLTLQYAADKLSTIGAMFRYIASFILAKFYVWADAIFQHVVNAKIAITSSVGKAGGKWKVFPYLLTLETWLRRASRKLCGLATWDNS